ncbi:MAG: hypothetical protein ACJAX1_001363 [Neolewinella sp.]|jgi:hypothetical protein
MIQLDGGRNGHWVVSTEFLDELTIAGSARVSGYDVVEWAFAPTVALKTKTYWHNDKLSWLVKYRLTPCNGATGFVV